MIVLCDSFVYCRYCNLLPARVAGGGDIRHQASGELARDGVVRQVQGRVTVTTEHRGGRHELK